MYQRHEEALSERDLLCCLSITHHFIPTFLVQPLGPELTRHARQANLEARALTSIDRLVKQYPQKHETDDD